MEWQSISIPDYPKDQYWFNSSVAETEAAQYTDVGWSFQENKCFEKALADFNGIASPAFFENVEFKMPWKSHEDIDFHYQALLKDIEDIESSEFVFEDIYKAKKSTKIDEHESSSILSQQFQWASNLSQKDREHQSSSILSKQKNKIRKQSRTWSGPWTEHEHKLFLMGLKEFGEGKWTSVCEHYVKTRTPTQVASHAQKYKLRQTSKTPKDRRKPSIHDIKLIDGNNVTFTATTTTMSPQLDTNNNHQCNNVTNYGAGATIE